MRYVIAVLAVLAVVAGLGSVKYAQISSLMAMGKQAQKSGPPPETVGTAAAPALQAEIDRKTVRAPFEGRLGIRLVNRGQYLPAGTAVTDLEATGAVYVDFTLPQQRLGDVRLGMPVRVTLEGTSDASAP